MSKYGSVRNVYIFDPLVINEDACRAQAMRKIADGVAESVLIHRHGKSTDCPFEPVTLHKTTEAASIENCYVLDKETK